MTIRGWLVFVLIWPVAVGFGPRAHAETGALKKAVFLPLWVPQAQFAGFYVAREKGMYEAQGVDLSILEGGPERSPAEYLSTGKADFSCLWLCCGIQARSRGVRLVNLAQTSQRSALMLVAKRKSGIRSIQDMEGKKVGMWGPGFEIQPRALFGKFGVHVTFVPQSFSINLFLRGGVDVASAMWYNEYHAILSAGFNPDELTTFFYNDYGLNFPEDGIYAMEETWRQDPDLCRGFVLASVEGWRYAFSHPDEALDIVMKRLKEAHLPAIRVRQQWMLGRMRELMVPEADPIPLGELRQEDYRRVAEVLLEQGAIDDVPSFSDFYKGNHGRNEKQAPVR